MIRLSLCKEQQELADCPRHTRGNAVHYRNREARCRTSMRGNVVHTGSHARGVAGEVRVATRISGPGPVGRGSCGARVEHARPGREVSKYFDHNKWGPARHAFNPLARLRHRAVSDHDPDRESAHPGHPRYLSAASQDQARDHAQDPLTPHSNPAEPRIAAFCYCFARTVLLSAVHVHCHIVSAHL